MREIKFRAWSKTNKKMLYRVLAGPGDPCSIVYDEDRKKWVQFDDACGDIMQYTGLKDKHGKEIYEGDICTIHDGMMYSPSAKKMVEGKYAVYWNDDRWGLKDAHGDDYDSGDFYRGNDIWWAKFEVIGNIYEHPEMVKT